MQYKSKGIGATKQYIKNAHDLYLIPKNVAVKNIANQGHIIVMHHKECCHEKYVTQGHIRYASIKIQILVHFPEVLRLLGLLGFALAP